MVQNYGNSLHGVPQVIKQIASRQEEYYICNYRGSNYYKTSMEIMGLSYIDGQVQVSVQIFSELNEGSFLINTMTGKITRFA